jgi:hypothetical protein
VSGSVESVSRAAASAQSPGAVVLHHRTEGDESGAVGASPFLREAAPVRRLSHILRTQGGAKRRMGVWRAGIRRWRLGGDGRAMRRLVQKADDTSFGGSCRLSRARHPPSAAAVHIPSGPRISVRGSRHPRVCPRGQGFPQQRLGKGLRGRASPFTGRWHRKGLKTFISRPEMVWPRSRRAPRFGI